MKILFHVGVGNSDRPQRWKFVNTLFSNLARTLEDLGHHCLVWYHNKAYTPEVYHLNINSNDIDGSALSIAVGFEPDWVFTWNGNSEGDKMIQLLFGKKVIFGELGFFNHYSTVQFDFEGTNGASENLTEKLTPFNKEIYDSLVLRYKKERLIEGEFIFVPLQDEKDTNITKHSPFKRMDELLSFVEANNTKNLPIVYKQHPKAISPLIRKHSNCSRVIGDVHHYLPYAKQVIGINSTVLLEALLYTSNVVTLGEGITNRAFKGEEHKQYVTHLYSKQMKWEELKDSNAVKNSIFYKRMTK
jgi:hypothetical protein